MKYSDIIKETKELYPNEYSDTELKRWITEAEQQAQIYAGEEPTLKNNLNEEVFIKEPYDRMLIDYVMAQISLHQHDDESYTRYMNAYSSRYREWQKHHIRTNEGKKIQFKNWI